MKNMCAPVIIGTMNRYEHLKACVESLKRNKYAIDTELYLSVDYPPCEKYFLGYSQIKNWVNSGIDGFKKVNIFFQRKNMGCERNYLFLVEKVKGKYDRFIYSEDDNVFSPNFLEYINKGLVLFENNEDVMAICGYSADFPWECKGGNVFAMQTSFAEWGYGIWIDRWEKMHSIINRNYYMNLFKDKRFCKDLFQSNYELYSAFINSILADPNDTKSVYINEEKEMAYIDYSIRIMMLAENYFAITPLITKVRNCGFDGSGMFCGRIEEDEHGVREIDSQDNFEYIIPDELKIIESNVKLYNVRRFKKAANEARMKSFLIRVLGLERVRKLLCYMK